MKRIFIFLLTAGCTLHAGAQSVGIGTGAPDTSALLHIKISSSVKKGLLVTGSYNDNATIPDAGAGSRLMFYPGKAVFRAGYVTGNQWDNANSGFYSTALGWNSIASGTYSTAMGAGATASGSTSTAMGGIHKRFRQYFNSNGIKHQGFR